MLPSDKLAAKNEQQRKLNAELREQLHRPHIQTQMSEARNTLGHVAKQLEEATSEFKGLENVLSHQEQQLTREQQQRQADAWDWLSALNTTLNQARTVQQTRFSLPRTGLEEQVGRVEARLG